jgi:amino acid adenylation domain-containing protein
MISSRTILQIFLQHVERNPLNKALTFLENGDNPTEQVTYGQLAGRIANIAKRLEAHDLCNKPVLLLFPNGIEFAAAFYACLAVGAIAVPAPYALSKRLLPRITNIANDCRPALALTTLSLKRNLAGNDADLFRCLPANYWLATDEFDSGTVAGNLLTPGHKNAEIAFLQYTSGSTSTPRGVVVTHSNLLANMRMIEQAYGHNAETAMLSWLPIFHDMGLIGNLIHPLYLGTHCVLLSPLSVITKPLRWLKAVSDYQPHTSGAPNFAYQLCVDQIAPDECQGLDLSSWKVAFNGAEPIRADTLQNFTARFAPFGFRAETFYPTYGLAEATLLVSGGSKFSLPVCRRYEQQALEQGKAVPANADADSQLLVSSGSAVAPGALCIVDPQRLVPCAEKQIGEIWLAGEHICQGYWQQPEASRSAFENRLESRPELFMRTGDLGFLDGGELFVTGRCKDLIILQGRNLFPHDIESAAEKAHPAIQPNAAAAFSITEDGQERLVVILEIKRQYRQKDLTQVFRNVREALWQTHEIQPHRIVCVNQGSNPKTSSGKLMRQRIKELFCNHELPAIAQQHDAAPLPAEAPAAYGEDGQDIITRLIGILSALARCPPQEIALDRSIMSLGLDSLQLAAFVQRVDERFGIALDFETLIDSPSLHELLQRIAQQKSGISASLPRSTVHTHPSSPEMPLTRGQQALWLLQQTAPGSDALNVAITIAFKRTFEDGEIASALAGLLQRYPILGCRIELRRGYPRLNWRTPEIPGETVFVADGNAAAAIQDKIDAFRTRPFDFVRDTLGRYLWFPQQQLLLLVFHHLVCDGSSLTALHRELEALAQNAAAPPPATAYARYLAWQEAKLAGDYACAALDYWALQLKDIDCRIPLRPVSNVPLPGPGFSRIIPISAQTLSRCGAWSQKHRLTRFTLLQSLLFLLLYRYGCPRSLCCGVVSQGRPNGAFAESIGYFTNLLPLRVDLNPADDFVRFAMHVWQKLNHARKFEAFPFSTLADTLNSKSDGMPNAAPFFSAACGYTRLPASDEVSIRWLPPNDVQFDIYLEFTEEGEDFRGALYLSRRYSPQHADALALEYGALLENVLERDNPPLASLLAPPLAAQDRLDRFLQRPAEPLPANSVIDLFQQNAAARPDQTALIFKAERMDYRTLDRRSDFMAARLRRLGIGPGAVVALYCEKSPDMIVGLLAVLKIGALCLPLDPDHPEARIAYLLSDSRAECVLITKLLFPRWTHDRCTPVAIEAETGDKHAVTLEANSPAYLMYTSGTSGEPKGAIITHGAIVSRLAYLKRVCAFTAEDCWLLSSSYNFDPSFIEIYLPLLCGASLVIPENGLQRSPDKLIRLMQQHRVTGFATVPSLLAALSDVEALENTQLRHVITGGEVLSRDLMLRFMQRSRAALHNLYGPTEATVFATHWRCEPKRDYATLPIGRPAPGTRIKIVGADGQNLPPGVNGEIYIGGAGLTLGYWNREELTRDRFADADGDRFYRSGDYGYLDDSGMLQFTGRKDNQIKLNGIRIELEEIEQQIWKSNRVKQVAVLVSEKSLTAVVQFFRGDSPEQRLKELQEHLRKVLPQHSLPHRYHPVAEFPMLGNGKIDRLALPALAARLNRNRQREDSPSKTPTEEKLGALWGQLLQRENIDREDHFFQLGGSSLDAMRLLAGIQQHWGLELSLTQLYETPLLKELAESIDRPAIENNCLICLQPGRPGVIPIVCAASGFGDVLRFKTLAEALGRKQPFYTLVPPKELMAQGKKPDIPSLATHYLQQIRQRGDIDGPFHLAGFSVGGLVAYEMLVQLEQRQLKMPRLIFLDCIYPVAKTAVYWGFRLLQWLITPLGRYWENRYWQWLRGTFTDLGLKAQLEAMIDYRVPHCSGDITFITTRFSSHFKRLFSALWQNKAPKVITIDKLPCNHEQMFYPPHVDKLAAIIHEALQSPHRDQ